MPTSELSQGSAPLDARVPRQLLEPNYQNRLRIVGRALDENDLEEAVILEIEDGFFLRAHSPARGGYMTETFTDDRLMQTLRVAIYSRGESGSGSYRSPLRPTGYEDFLRALGYRLDRRAANAITIVECSRYFHVSGDERIGDEYQAAMTPFAELLEVPGINHLVNEAIGRRSRGAVGRAIDADHPVRIIRTGARRW
ncbi:MAG: hypothetical protein R3A46_14075 [Thermomicrobiales bacterium]